MRNTYAKYGEHGLSALKYVIAAVTMLAGISTCMAATQAVSGPLGFIYGTRAGLVIFGLLVFSSGFTLLIAKLTRERALTGTGLMACYLCFLFATIIQILAFGIDPGYWAWNAIFALLTGALWLRWRFKTAYINPGHFRQDVIEMKRS